MGSDSSVKLRLLHFIVQPVLVFDDGEQFTPGPTIEPQPATLEGLRQLAVDWPERISEIEAQLDSGG